MSQKTTTHQMGSAAKKRTTPQKIVICIDGTGQDETKPTATNVRKFSNLLLRDPANQKVLYFAGVGSRTDKQQSGKLFGKSGGSGAKRLRYEALAKLTLNYKPGDTVYIVGFSRGAAICRTLANAIHKEGIPETIKITRDGDGAFKACKSAKKKGEVHRPEIEMVGLLDTVASFGVGANVLGIPFQKINLFKNFSIAPNIKKAYHLLSIDEQRDAFQPTLMNAEDRISETWFAGVHTDVGGGYKKRQLSDITLTYLVNRARSHGLQFDEAKVSEPATKIAPDCCGPLHERFRFLGYKLGRRKIRVKVTKSNEAATDMRPKLHKSVIERMRAPEAHFITKKQGDAKRKYAPKNVVAPVSKNYRIDRKD